MRSFCLSAGSKRVNISGICTDDTLNELAPPDNCLNRSSGLGRKRMPPPPSPPRPGPGWVNAAGPTIRAISTTVRNNRRHVDRMIRPSYRGIVQGYRRDETPYHTRWDGPVATRLINF